MGIISGKPENKGLKRREQQIKHRLDPKLSTSFPQNVDNIMSPTCPQRKSSTSVDKSKTEKIQGIT